MQYDSLFDLFTALIASREEVAASDCETAQTAAAFPVKPVEADSALPVESASVSGSPSGEHLSPGL